jgi:hypothetical protein
LIFNPVLKLFRNHNPFAVIALFGVAVCLKLSFLIHPEIVPVLPQQVVWGKVIGLLHSLSIHSAFGFTFLALINIVGQALYLNKIALSCHLFNHNTYLPALSYVLITSLLPDWNYFSALLLANWFILAALDGIMKLYAHQDPRKLLFNTGCLFSLSILLVSSGVFFILLFFIALAILRPFKISEWVMALLGLCTPFYFLAGILFLFGKLLLLTKIFTIGLPQHLWQDASIDIYIVFTSLLVLLLCGAYYLNLYSSRMLIQIKKSWAIIIATFSISLAVRFFNVLDGFYAWLPAMLPLSLIFTNLWIERKRSWFPKIIFYLFVVAILFVQWAPTG